MANQLAGDGTELVVVARDQARLEALAESVDVSCEVLVADLSDRDALAMVEDRLAATGADAIDLCVNNAGFGNIGPFRTLDRDRETDVVEVNIVALHRLSHAAATAMVAAGGPGGILNVSSMATWLATPNTATYNATKAFVTLFSDILHAELKPEGIHVSALCPGLTRTEFQDRAGYDATGVPAMAWQTAEEVAAAGLAGVASNTPVVIPGAKNQAAIGLLNSLPMRLRRPLVSRLAN